MSLSVSSLSSPTDPIYLNLSTFIISCCPKSNISHIFFAELKTANSIFFMVIFDLFYCNALVIIYKSVFILHNDFRTNTM